MKETGEVLCTSNGSSSFCLNKTIETKSSSLIPASQTRFGSFSECDIEISAFVFPRDSNRCPVFKHNISGIRVRLIFMFFQILNPVDPRSSSIGLNPNCLIATIVSFVPAAPTASLRRKLSSLLKFIANRTPPKPTPYFTHLSTLTHSLQDLHSRLCPPNDCTSSLGASSSRCSVRPTIIRGKLAGNNHGNKWRPCFVRVRKNRNLARSRYGRSRTNEYTGIKHLLLLTIMRYHNSLILLKGSSVNSGNRCSDLQKEAFRIPETVGHSFNYFDFVVHAF